MSKKIKLDSKSSAVMAAATTTVFTAEEFDFAAVKKMMSFEFDESATRICSFPILDYLADDDGAGESESHLFGLKDGVGWGQLSVKPKNLHWKVFLSLYGFEKKDRAKWNPIKSSYFVCRARFEDGEQNLTRYCSLMSTIGKQVYLAVDHASNPAKVLVEVYQIPAVIPRYLTANCSVAVGKILVPKRGFRSVDGENKFMDNTCFNFGTARMHMLPKFVGGGRTWVIAAIMYILKSGATDRPLMTTFTIFSGKDNVKNYVRTIVFRRKGDEIRYSFTLAFYKDVEELVENGEVFFKAILQPAP